MAAGQDESISVGPHRLFRIIGQILGPKLKRYRCQCHWRPRMSAIGSLDAVHAQSSNSINSLLSEAGSFNSHFGIFAREKRLKIDDLLVLRVVQKIPRQSYLCNRPETCRWRATKKTGDRGSGREARSHMRPVSGKRMA